MRVLGAAAALEAGNIVECGRLMNESHVSMRDDYESAVPSST
jgi:galactokinase